MIDAQSSTAGRAAQAAISAANRGQIARGIWPLGWLV
jgi:hypothetical protein